MSNDEYAGSTRDNKRHRATSNGANGLERSDVSYSGNGGVCTENETSCIKICGSAARKVYIFVQTGWRRFSPIIKEPFYIIGEVIVNTFEHPIIRATVYAAIIVCIIAFFIMIGYVLALYEYGITPVGVQ